MNTPKKVSTNIFESNYLKNSIPSHKISINSSRKQSTRWKRTLRNFLPSVIAVDIWEWNSCGMENRLSFHPKGMTRSTDIYSYEDQKSNKKRRKAYKVDNNGSLSYWECAKNMKKRRNLIREKIEDNLFAFLIIQVFGSFGSSEMYWVGNGKEKLELGKLKRVTIDSSLKK